MQGKFFASSVGFLEFASGAFSFCPGIWIMEKQYGSVFSLSDSSLSFLISPRCRFLRTPSSGLWSVATTKFSQPSTKWRADSNPKITANASPSRGTYLDSAGWVNLLPANTIFHPVEQQIEMMTSQVQYFCKSQKQMPFLEQYVARHLTLLGSNIRTPSVFLFSIAALDCSKTCCSWSSQ